MPWWTHAQYHAFRSDILSDLEADDMGVYEVWWTANTAYPERPLSDRLLLAEVLVMDLVRTNKATVWRGAWEGSARGGTALALPDLAVVLREWTTWVPQEDEVARLVLETDTHRG